VNAGSYYHNYFFPNAKADNIPNALITEMITKINRTEIYNTISDLQNFTTRMYRSPGNEKAAAYIFERLQSIPNLNVEYQGYHSNIIATLLGADATLNDTYIVGAHYDSISSDPNNAPGATDNGGGVAIVLEFARIMSQYEFNHTITFAFWNAEEVDSGSAEYVQQAYENKSKIPLYLNFDSSCSDPKQHLVLDIMFNDQSAWVSDMMTEYNTLYGINLNLTYNVHTCGSDYLPFWAYGYTAVMTHEEEHAPQMHTPQDTIDIVSTEYAQKNGQLGMSVFATLAGAQKQATLPPSPEPSTSNSIPTSFLPSIVPSQTAPSSTSFTDSTPTPIAPEFPTLLAPSFLITALIILVLFCRKKTLN
jgi:hypothetical protein